MSVEFKHAREADRYHEPDVAPWVAGLGAEVAAPTLVGLIKLRIPPGTENGQQLRMRGRGLPKGKNGERGDFHVIVAVHWPTKLGDEERAQWEKLRASSPSILEPFRPHERRVASRPSRPSPRGTLAARPAFTPLNRAKCADGGRLGCKVQCLSARKPAYHLELIVLNPFHVTTDIL